MAGFVPGYFDKTFCTFKQTANEDVIVDTALTLLFNSLAEFIVHQRSHCLQISAEIVALHPGKLHKIDWTTYCCPNQQQTNIPTGQMLSLQCTEFGYDQAKYISVWRLISKNTEELLTDYSNSNKEGMSVS